MKKFLVAVFFITIIFSTAEAQNLDSTIAKYAANYQPEKVYLQYDKASYYAGETVWFKAYLMQGIFAAADAKNLYVDWIADNGTVLSHTVSPIVDASTNGQLDIPANYSGNYIHVRAYTKWMLNFDTAFLYSKNIRIISKDAVQTKTSVAVILSLELFPEGGDIVYGIKNKIAFKAADQYGRPFSIKGKLVDDKGTVFQNFSSVHDGMGSFFIIPQEGNTYFVKWTDQKNAEHTTALPSIKNNGISIQVSINGTKRIVAINGAESLSGNLKQLHLIGTMNQQMVFKNDVVLNNGSTVSRTIPTEALLSGILTITVFDANWNAIAERITFVNNHDYTFQPSMEVTHWGLSKRKRDEIKISIPDSLQGANLSIAITDAAIEKDTSDNIVSHFMLSGDIKGRVYNPAYYFSNNSDSTAQQLDLVMLTNGWRRFKWEDVTKGVFPKINYPKDTSYMYLSGKLFGVANSQLSGKESIALIVKKDSSTQMFILPVNRDGTFYDPSIIFFDTVKVYYSLKSKFLTNADARFMTERLPAPNYSAFSKNFVYSNSLLDTTGLYRHRMLGAKSLELLNAEKGHVMENVVITTTKKPAVQVMDEKYTSGLFRSGDGYQFDLVNDPFAQSSLNIFNYLTGKVAGLQINPSSNPPSLSWRGGAPAIYLDEVPTDASMISNIPVTDVAYVKVFRPPFMGSFNGANGAIAIYTRKGNDRMPASGGGLSANTVAGYTPIKQFYSPNYDAFDPRNDHLDVRTTLYWNPELSIFSQNKKTVTVSFYNNDVTQSFRVVIEGMTREGLLAHYETIME